MIGSDLSNRICEVLAFDGHFLANLFWGFRRIARRDSVSLERMERGIRPLAETSKPARNRQLLGEMQRLLLADSVAKLFCASERARLSQDQAPPLRHSFSRMAPARTPWRSSSTTSRLSCHWTASGVLRAYRSGRGIGAGQAGVGRIALLVVNFGTYCGHPRPSRQSCFQPAPQPVAWCGPASSRANGASLGRRGICRRHSGFPTRPTRMFTHLVRATPNKHRVNAG
jgi:hypothetical protein